MQEYVNPTSAALEPISSGAGGYFPRLRRPLAPNNTTAWSSSQIASLRAETQRRKKTLRKLCSIHFRAKSLAGKVTGILPINVAFPAFGPSIFLVSELTSENQFPAAEFSFQRDKKAGVR